MPSPVPDGRCLPFTAGPAPAPPLATGTVTTVDDIRRAYYDTADYSMWVTEVQVGPAGLALIVCDDDSGELFRVPVTTGPNGQVSFGPAAPVLTQYVPAPPEPPGQPGTPPGPGPGRGGLSAGAPRRRGVGQPGRVPRRAAQARHGAARPDRPRRARLGSAQRRDRRRGR